MIDKELGELSSQISELEEMRLSMLQLQSRINHTFDDLEKSMDKSFQLSFLIDDLKRQIDDIDLDELGNTIDYIEDKINSLSYHYKRAFNAQQQTVYKVQNPFSTPLYHKKP